MFEAFSLLTNSISVGFSNDDGLPGLSGTALLQSKDLKGSDLQSQVVVGMGKTLQALIGIACLVVIVGGGWVAYSQYSAHVEAERFEAFRSEMNLKRQAIACNELLRRPNDLSDFEWDMCNSIKQQVRKMD